jgi:pyruvate-formate lyase-activating enzyme
MTPADLQALSDCAQLASSNAWAFRRVATWQQLGHIREELHERVTMGWTPLGPVEMAVLLSIIDILAQGPTLEIRVPAPPGPETLARLREFLAQPVPDAPEVVV